jgi:hypothetical protein
MRRNQPKSLAALAAEGARERQESTRRQREKDHRTLLRTRKRAEAEARLQAGREPRRTYDETFEKAVIPRWFSWFRGLLGVALVAAFVVGTAIAWDPSDRVMILWWIVACAQVVVGGFGAYFVTQPLHVLMFRRSLRWLEAFPYRLEMDTYENALAARHTRGRLVARLHLGSRVPQKWRQVLVDAMVKLMPQATLAWHDDHCVSITSPEMVTSEPHRNGTIYDNRRLHAWFHKLAHRALPIIHREFPIDRVSCHFQGS